MQTGAWTMEKAGSQGSYGDPALSDGHKGHRAQALGQGEGTEIPSELEVK